MNIDLALSRDIKIRERHTLTDVHASDVMTDAAGAPMLVAEGEATARPAHAAGPTGLVEGGPPGTGIGMSVRGEQFWLDKARAAQLRPRARPRYTLTPSIVLRNGEPFSGGTTQSWIP